MPPYLERPREKASNPRSMEAYAQAYVEHLKTINYAVQGVKYKHACLRWFIEWCRERGIDRIEMITRPVLQRYQRYLHYAVNRHGKPLTTSTQCNRLTAVRTWFQFLMRENLLLYNPASEMEYPKREKRLPKHTLTAEEAELVLAQPDLETPKGIRDRAILEVLYSTGIRRAELLNLACHDVSASSGVLAIRQGKGKKDRFVPIGERALVWVEKYRDDVRPLHALPAGADNLFLEITGIKIDPHVVGRAVKKYVKQSGIEKTGSCHLFRHTMATLMLENGADIRFIQQMLGHALLSTTEIYTHVAIHKLKQIHTLTHPGKLAKRKQPEPLTDEITAEELLAQLAEESEDEESEDD